MPTFFAVKKEIKQGIEDKREAWKAVNSKPIR